MSTLLIGRNAERAELDECMKSDKSELVVLYGRRRIGKTFLIRNYFNDQFAFSFTGAKDFTKVQQLDSFSKALQQYSGAIARPELSSWIDAFDHLERLLRIDHREGKKVVFLDEMPWIDTQKSGFIAALANFWNSWAAHRGDIVLIACGSATSWIVDKLLHNKGGLFNRVTRHLYLRPFTLGEVEQYLDHYNFGWDRYQITQCYMALGGVPFYLTLLRPEYSLAQNIDRLFFSGVNAQLRVEYGELFSSLFNKPTRYVAVVKALTKHIEGLTRSEISQHTSISGERLTDILNDLERCDFIFSLSRYGNKKNNKVFRIKDFYSMFYFRFVEDCMPMGNSSWSQQLNSSRVQAWEGLAFEIVCLLHEKYIKKALGISVILSSVSTWRSKSPDSHSQIDLVIERADRIINLCEIKFCRDQYNISKDYATRLLNRKSQFVAETGTRYATQLTMVTPFGIMKGKNASMIASQVVIDDLFDD